MPALRKPLKDWARTPEQEEAFQRMQAKCQARAHPPINGSSGVDSETQGSGVALDPSLPIPPRQAECNSPPAATLVWNRKSKYEMISGCQQFQILKECIGNISRNGVNYSNGRTVYQCWRRVEQLWYIKFEPHQATFDAAKEICEAYARAHPFGHKAADV